MAGPEVRNRRTNAPRYNRGVERPLVSLVIPSHDGRRLLERLLPSVQGQDACGAAFETIVVDNGSSDGTAEWLAAAHPGIRVLRNGRNGGFAEPCNRGAREARGEWVAFLNNDLVLPAEWMGRYAEAARSGRADAYSGKLLSLDGKRVLFAGGGLNFHGAGYQEGHGLPAGAPLSEREELLFGCGASLWVRRGTFLGVGGFDPDYFAYHEDVDLGWRMRLLGHRTAYLPSATAFHAHQGTSSRFPRAELYYHCERNMLRSLVKNLEEANLFRILSAALWLLNRRMTLGYPFPLPSFPFPGEEVPAPPRRPRRDPVSLLRKAWTRLRVPHSPEYREAMARVRAMDDVLSELDVLWEKRAWVQSRRVAPDAEIFPLFRDPLHVVAAQPSYALLQERVFELFGLARLFSPPAGKIP